MVKDVSLDNLLENIRQDCGKPLNYLNRTERMECLEKLEEQGFFNLKGAVQILASEMGKSRYTIYADLRDLRQEKSR